MAQEPVTSNVFLSFLFFKNSIEMDDDFVEMVKLLVPYILSRDMMMTKRINGMEVTGKDMSKYVRVSAFNTYKHI